MKLNRTKDDQPQKFRINKVDLLVKKSFIILFHFVNLVIYRQIS